jgi:putative aminopeptidase FrvX
MTVDHDFLKALTEIPSVGTACRPILNLLARRFGDGWTRTFIEDGFCLFQKQGGTPADLRVLFVAHVDEVGGCVYGTRPEGGFHARAWGNRPAIFADATLQAFDYLAESEAEAFPVVGQVVFENNDERLAIWGDGVRPYRTGWTFKEETRFDGDIIEGKALDPRVTVYAVAEAALALDDPQIGVMFVLAEECAMDVALKGVEFLRRNAPNLSLIANADVPGIANIGDGRLDLPVIRVFEGTNFIDPAFGIQVAETLIAQGVELHLSAARSGSQTRLFTPLAPTLSIALPSDGVHLPRYRMSLTGTARCVALLRAVGEWGMQG